MIKKALLFLVAFTPMIACGARVGGGLNSISTNTTGAGNFIHNVNNLQSGATFFVSSGTVQGPFSVTDGTHVIMSTFGTSGVGPVLHSQVPGINLFRISASSRPYSADLNLGPFILLSPASIGNDRLSFGVDGEVKFFVENNLISFSTFAAFSNLVSFNGGAATIEHDGDSFNFVGNALTASDTLDFTASLAQFNATPIITTSTGTFGSSQNVIIGNDGTGIAISASGDQHSFSIGDSLTPMGMTITDATWLVNLIDLGNTTALRATNEGTGNLVAELAKTGTGAAFFDDGVSNGLVLADGANAISVNEATLSIDYSGNLTTTGVLSVGDATQSTAHTFDGDTYPVTRLTRHTVATNSQGAEFDMLLKTTGDMADNFGGGITFSVQDDTAGPNIAAAIYGVRDGANDSLGQLDFRVNGALTLGARITNDLHFGVAIHPLSTLHMYEDSTDTGGNAGLTIEQDGTGDAIAQFLITGIRRWVVGIDNSASDRFKFSSSSDLSSNSMLQIDTSGNVFMPNDTALTIGTAGDSAVSFTGSDLKFDSHLITATDGMIFDGKNFRFSTAGSSPVTDLYMMEITMDADTQRGLYINGLTNDFTTAASSSYLIYGEREINLNNQEIGSMFITHLQLNDKSTNALFTSSHEAAPLHLRVRNEGLHTSSSTSSVNDFSSVFFNEIWDTGTYDNTHSGVFSVIQYGARSAFNTGGVTLTQSTGGSPTNQYIRRAFSAEINADPTVGSGNWTIINYGLYVDVDSTPAGNNYGIYINDVSNGTNNYGIFDNSGAIWRMDDDGARLQIGESGSELELEIDAGGTIGVIDVNSALWIGNNGTNYTEVSATGDVVFVGSSGLAYGGISTTTNSTETVIAGAGTPVQVTIFQTNSPSNNTTPDHTNDHVTISKAGDYMINVSATVNSVSGAASRFEMTVQKNNGASDVGALHCDRNLGGGGSEAGVISMSGIATLAASDTIEVWIENETNTQNYIVEDIDLSLIQIGG